MNNAQSEKNQATLSRIVTLFEDIGTVISEDGFGKVASMNLEIFEGFKTVIDNILSVEDVVEKNYAMALDCVGMLKEELSSDLLSQMRLQVIELSLQTNSGATQTIYTNLHNFAELTSSGIEWNTISSKASANIEKDISEINVAIMNIMKEMNEN